jgi:hypothetical protein
MRRFFGLGILALALGASARADNFSSYVSGPGQDIGNGQYGGAFAVSHNGGPSFAAFCVDLTDEVGFGSQNFTGTIKTNDLLNNPRSYAPASVTVANEVGYILTHIWAPGVKTDAFNAAVQDALWVTMCNPSYYANAEAAGYIAAAAAAVAANPTTNYQVGTFMITPDDVSPPNGHLQYQVLVGVVPEPSTMAIAGLGVLGFVGYGLRRKRAR